MTSTASSISSSKGADQTGATAEAPVAVADRGLIMNDHQAAPTTYTSTTVTTTTEAQPIEYMTSTQQQSYTTTAHPSYVTTAPYIATPQPEYATTYQRSSQSGYAQMTQARPQGAVYQTSSAYQQPMMGQVSYPTAGMQQTATVTQQQMPVDMGYGKQAMPNYGEGAYQTETRKVSSVVVESNYLEPMPNMQQETVRYVDVPQRVEEVRYVTKKETREVEKRVTVPQIEYVDRVVEVPVVQYIDIPKEVEVVQEVVVEKKVPVYQDRVVDSVVEVKVPQVRRVEKIREVPGPIVEVPKPYTVEQPQEVARFVDREVPVVIAQTIRPVITESSKQLQIDVLDYEPEVVPIDVHVAKPVPSVLECIGQRETKHRLVTITPAQYNTVLRRLNAHMGEQTKASLPYVAERGQVPFIPDQELHYIVAPRDINVEGWNVAPQQVYSPPPIVQTREDESLMISEAPANKSRACCGPKAKKAEPSVHSHYSSQYPSQYQSGQHPSQYPSVQHPSQYPSQYPATTYPSTAQPGDVIYEHPDGTATIVTHPKQRVCC